MVSLRTKLIFAAVLVVAALAAGAFAILNKAPILKEPETVRPPWPIEETIGVSTEGRAIQAFTYGTGGTKLLFVGGIHGGYEWNSVLLAYRFMDYLKTYPDAVPADLAVTVIPSANPDGVYKVVGIEGRFAAADVSPDAEVNAEGRFNARGVDLNRNFDCHWQPTSTWKSRTVSAGTAPFSEPEAQAIRNFVLEQYPDAVIFWHSQAGAVYASECEEGILPGTLDLMNAYADASGYRAIEFFDAYPTTGDSEGWLASIGIPSITVELQTHTAIEWDKNLAGSKALLMLYSGK